MEKTKILLIDDEADFCRMTKMNLESTGKYEVRTQTVATQGLATAKEYQPDLIILDFRMPEMHGSDVAAQIQDDPETEDIPIIFLTGVATKDELRRYGDEIMCNLVLAKPASVEEIINAIETNLGKRTKLGFLSRLFTKDKKLFWKK